MTPARPTTSPAIRQDSEGLNEILDAVPVALILLDAQGRTLHMNPSAAGLFGRLEDWWGAWAASTTAPADRDWRGLLDSVLRTGSNERLSSVRCARVDGAGRTFDVDFGRVRRGTDFVALVAVHDATQLDELTRRLAATENLAAVGKLAARVAHELNNPLDGTLRYAGLAARLVDKLGMEAEPAGKIREYLEHMRAGLLRMTRIVSDLLEFSRNAPVLKESGNINRVVEEALQALAHLADAHQVAVLADFHDDNRMPALADTRLYQVCCNLIRNAIDAMPSGGRLTVRTGIVDDTVVVRIADSGGGLPEDVERVFEPFYTTKPTGQGTGLGLAICREFLAQLGGRISAENARDGGAVFTVRIPVERCAAADKNSEH